MFPAVGVPKNKIRSLEPQPKISHSYKKKECTTSVCYNVIRQTKSWADVNSPSFMSFEIMFFQIIRVPLICLGLNHIVDL